MSPSELDDDQLNAVHDGATPVYFKNRPAYYSWIAKGISGCDRVDGRSSPRSDPRGSVSD
jgi:hypothetical protein